MNFYCLENLEVRGLAAPLSEGFFFALSSLKGDEALGSDGFTLTFW